MANLTRYLQDEFRKNCPEAWEVKHETHFLSKAMERILGYAPRADVLFTKRDGSRRLWVEFEISRADPVANHAKFATGHLFAPFPSTDSFVSMVSSHIAKGRRNLAANTILLMRQVGIDAFQIPLLPTIAPDRIKQLNYTPLLTLCSVGLDVRAEVDRCLTLPQQLCHLDDHKILFASNALEVFLNVERWNHELRMPEGQQLWGKRRGQYFVFSPASGLFAPAKFCAFTSAQIGRAMKNDDKPKDIGGFMSLNLYASLDESESRFDGKVAWQHLVKNLGFARVALSASGQIGKQFQKWAELQSNHLDVSIAEPIILTPPAWD